MRLFLFFLFLFNVSTSIAQNISPCIINASGGSAAINSNIYEWNITEMIDVTTYNTGINYITCGLLQPIDDKLSINLLPNCNTTIAVYPNPFNNNLNLNIKTDQFKDVQIVVKNVLGQLVFQQEYSLLSNNETINFNLNHLSVGPYIIEVKNNSCNILLTEKIFKND